MNILGAGLSGLICGALNAASHIYERNASDFISHRAVLRFRDDKIARALGINFRKVTVRKAIWWEDAEALPSPRLANLYSNKVRKVFAENSLWNIAPSERFIAPDNLHSVLADICGTRVHWKHEIDKTIISELLEQKDRPLVSTLPLPILLKILGQPEPMKFGYWPITIERYRVANCDVFQTIYFPDPAIGIYRATLTGELLTIEGVGQIPDEETQSVFSAFGMTSCSYEHVLSNHKQSFGKIAPVPEGARKALLHRLTQEFGIYTLGRFATWRNILLDDVYEDVAAIRKMITQSQYDNALERTRV